MDKAAPLTGNDLGTPQAELADPINSSHPRTVPLKRIHFAGQASAIKFVPPSVKAMSSSQPFNSSSTSPRVLILNDSFHNMLDYKAKHNKFPSTYDDMFVFLSEVHIQLYSYSIWLVFFILFWFFST